MGKDRGQFEGVQQSENDWSNVPFWSSQRFLTAVLAFWGFAVLYFQRINLSIAIVCMVKSSSNVTSELAMGLNSSLAVNTTAGYALASSVSPLTTQAPLQPGDEGYCDALELSKAKDGDIEEGEFDWDKSLQGMMHGSFYWGYLLLQVPGGWLSERYGPRRVIFWSMMPVAILGFLSPVAARLSPYLFIVVRVLIGVGEGVLYPANQALWARWSPPHEKSRLVGTTMAGGQFGNALIFPMGGILCSSVNWESVFYVMAAIGFVWSILWFVLVADSPEKNTRISPLERRYIQAHTTFREGQKPPQTPWCAIFTDFPFWVILVAHTCNNYGLYMMLTQIPTYMKEVLKFDLKSNGALSMLPYLTMWMFITIAGTIADKMMTNNVLSRKWTRKLMAAIGSFLPAVFMVLVSFLDCTSQTLAVVFMCLAVGFSGFAFAGCLVNHGDIAPQFAGTMFGITNIAATIPGFVAPAIVGALTQDKSRESWQVAFFVCAAVYAFGGLFYVLFSQTDRAKWAQTPVQTVEAASPEHGKMIDDQRV